MKLTDKRFWILMIYIFNKNIRNSKYYNDRYNREI